MKITTNFDARDAVYFMHENKIASGNLKDVNVTYKLDLNSLVVSWQVWRTGIGGFITVLEKDMYKTKADLIKSLQ